ncbi:UDP-N-acetylmuramoyl-L-alanyl-D-glutamate--2,6-diaminopimelate ligase [Hirschia maritima]|uniref:UDP-N-acetylmuramoyl-L-alanyl-D-glutamate--2, 6-diaminopimelate ligase n=1 Tax=Hirschia maritima TaxID=1121961 RepID=UPI0003801FB5|nr:UDP-N-acetylmuramoyl-L-alanyl-D-glutamate--2,6-diaminopimelate ligase [Hirschia maritima]
MKLSQVFENAPDWEFTGLTSDSRKVAPGFVFAAIKGTVSDGRDFIQSAIDKGAVAILTDEREGEWDIPAVKVAEPRLVLANAAAAFYGVQPETMVAVTGTNGKSSTVDFLRQIWEDIGLVSASVGTLGAVGPSGAVELGHTTPDPVAVQSTLAILAKEGVTHCAMEASSHGLAQYRMHGVKLAAGAFLNLSQDHLDYHKDLDDYFTAKMKLFTELVPEGAPAVINADSDMKDKALAVAEAANLKPFTVGWRGDHLWIDEITPRNTGQKLQLQWETDDGDKETIVNLPLIGEFQALNALTAAGLAMSLGAEPTSVFSAMEKLKGVKGRLELVAETQNGAGVFVDFAHTPDGLDVLLRAARPHAAGRVICVFGCGGDRDAGKRPIMGEIASKFADEVIVTDDNPRSEDPASIRAAIMKGAPNATEIEGRAEAIKEGISRLQKGDVLMIAGKGHETGQIIKGEVFPFSDHEAALSALAELEGGQ